MNKKVFFQSFHQIEFLTEVRFTKNCGVCGVFGDFNSSVSDAHMEKLDSVQKFIEKQGWLLLTFCIHSQLSDFNSIIVQMSEKRDSSSKVKMNGCFFQ